MNGDKRFSASQWVAKEQVEFGVRWSQDVADLTPLDRIICPAIAHSNIYDAIAVHEVGRREGLRILTARRADTA